MNQYSLTKLGVLLERSIADIEKYEHHEATLKKGQTLHVPNVAGVLLFAYEQLRNASENIEDHLLLQKAILRFYKRNLPLASMPEPKSRELGKELTIELTQAQYLKNDSVSLSAIQEIDALIDNLVRAYEVTARYDNSVSKQTAESWILELLSVKTEQLYSNHVRILSFAHFAHTYFSETIDYDKVIGGDRSVSEQDYAMLLYVSVHKALLKSDDANIRNSLLDLYSISSSDTTQFVRFNTKFDEIIASSAAVTLTRFVSKNGAPLRIVKAMFFDDHAKYKSQDIRNMPKTILAVNSRIDAVYAQISSSVKKGVFKSILFLLITKLLIGFLIEVPYDIAVTGSIIILPLVINMLFPPIYLAFTALTFKVPGKANKKALADYIETMLYENPARTSPVLKYSEKIENSLMFNVVFGVVFVAVFYMMATRLAALDFNIVQGIIFIIFLSTASFLGYRLTVQIKEIEHIATNQGFVALVRDFLYTPFVFAGKRISHRFSQLNIIAQVLDTAVDLPLKTVARLFRQWLTFMNSKKDELI